MAVLCLVRHGESEGNKNKQLSGFYEDHELTNHGVEQAELCGLKLLKYDFDAVFTSRLSRSIATAQLILNKNVHKKYQWLKLEELNERNYGAAGGMTREGLLNYYTDDVLDTWFNSLNGTPPGGENLFSVYKRCNNFYKTYLTDIIQDMNVLVVSHSHITKCLMTIIEDLPIKSICSLTVKNAQPIIYEF